MSMQTLFYNAIQIIVWHAFEICNRYCLFVLYHITSIIASVCGQWGWGWYSISVVWYDSLKSALDDEQIYA